MVQPFRDWWRSLERAPEPLSRGQWAAVAALSLAAAVSRLFAIARTPWDWDELLFMLSLDHFDVARHHPHPPGFPLYILAAKFFRNFGFSDFRALQSVSVLAAIAIVPAMFFCCRELRMSFSAALSAAMLLAFFPNVWVYGGSALSDVPSMTLIVLAIGLLLAGCRSRGAWLAGALVLAVSIAVRPQNLLVGVAPFLIASRFRKRQIVYAILIVTIVVGASYLAAAWLTGWSAYFAALQAHRAYIVRTDSFLAAVRPPLWRVFDDFFVMPYRAPLINALVCLLAFAGLLRRRPPVLVALASFGPLSIFTWLMLDHFSASRFSIGYAPLIAILAADTLWVLCASVVIACIVWTWPALATLRTEISPPVRAVTSIPRNAVVYVQTAMSPFAEWYLRGYRVEDIGDAPPPAAWSDRQPAVYLSENPRGFPHGRLWDIVRRRYFDVTARPLAQRVVFRDGWYAEEGTAAQPWRWMGGHSEALLPATSGDAHLDLAFYVPLDALDAPPTVTIRIDGRIVDRFVANSQNVERHLVVRGRTLTIDTDRVAKPRGDPRVLGLRLNAMVWTG